MKSYIPLLFALLFVTSCEKPLIDDTPSADVTTNDEVTLTINISGVEQIPFENTTSRATALSSLCSRVNIAIFSGETKQKTINQTSDQTDFGSAAITLPQGQYQLVVIAHNGKGNATISTPDKITFPNNKCTDTFYYYGTIDVDKTSSKSITLHRAVAMYRQIITDATPANVAQMQFFYTGGSSTFNAVTGFGCVNSRQTETFDVASGQPSQYEVYTFPHDVTGTLNMKVTALDATGTTVCEQVYDNLPVQLNTITQHTGPFFTNATTSEDSRLTIAIDNDGQWSPSTISY